MPLDKYSAVWVSNSSINDFISCPRLYYLRNVYRDPMTHHKINIISPSLALGSTVHEVLESLSILPVGKRLQESLLKRFDISWQRVTGKSGGFRSPEEEEVFKEKGSQMLSRVMENPGPLHNKAVKIKKELPNYYLSEEDNIVLCGKIDWLEYIPGDDSVHIIDFKTGKHDESAESLQLPIYSLLVHNLQQRKVSKASYWYLDRENAPTQVQLPDLNEAYEKVLHIAKQVKKTRLVGEYKCLRNGCYACKPFEKILQRDAEFVGVGTYQQDLYVVR